MLYIKYKFNSFYRMRLFNAVQNHPSSFSTNNVMSTDISFYFFIFLLNTYSYSSTNKNTPLYYSTYALPFRKKSVIFLRAPYKNKLARLNIIRFYYKAIFSLKYRLVSISDIGNCNVTILLNSIYRFAYLELSTSKIKHVQTKINFEVSAKSNFLFETFLLE